MAFLKRKIVGTGLFVPNLFKNPLNFSVGFQNIEGLHSDCECFHPDITENIKKMISTFFVKRGHVTTKKKLQATNIYFRTVLKRLVSKLVDPQEDYYFMLKNI